MLNCMNGAKGQNLLASVSRSTPQHTYVPWVTVHGVHNVTAEKNLQKFVCSSICQNASLATACPVVCSGYNTLVRKESGSARNTAKEEELVGCPNPFYEGGSAPLPSLLAAEAAGAPPPGAAVGPHGFGGEAARGRR